jgi:hypothetical protein
MCTDILQKGLRLMLEQCYTALCCLASVVHAVSTMSCCDASNCCGTTAIHAT